MTINIFEDIFTHSLFLPLITPSFKINFPFFLAIISLLVTYHLFYLSLQDILPLMTTIISETVSCTFMPPMNPYIHLFR